MNFENFRKNFINVITSDRYYDLLEIYNLIHFETIQWMKKKNIVFVCLPITTQSISSPMGIGSDSKPYKVKSIENNNEFYLADSMQFYLELLLRAKNLNKVGYFTNTFRGENVDKRHLHQFNHFEIEIKGDIKLCKNLAFNYIKYIVKKTILNLKDNNLIKANLNNLNDFINKKYYDLDYFDAISILKNDCPSGITNKNNINSIGERYLIKKFNNSGIFLNNFPAKLVPFYQKNVSNRAINSDFLIGIGETIGMGQRCETYEETINSIRLHNNNPNEYNWYFKMKKEKPMQTSGFGVGIERLILFLINEDDIRNVVVLPRDTNENIEP
ncbi:asparagine synthetase A [Metamycoplasma equirhinis]|uniref:asparagine synthetase A n=1 Tax=Metamycoplasma equirhinis TaxID=92402 RepID=UPI00359C6F27